MQFLLILVCVIISSMQNIFKKHFGQKCSHGDFLFSALVTGFSLLFFVVSGLVTGNLPFSWEIVPYSLIFAIAYASATITGVLALRWGSLAITSLVMSYSLVIPTLWGLIVLKEPAGWMQFVGLAILLVSLFLIKGPRTETDKRGFSMKWLIAIAISFVGNGTCSVVQNTQRRVFEGVYNTTFMIVALSIAVLVALVAALFTERKHFKEIIRVGLIPGALCGLCNGGLNMLVMVITALVASAIFFPVLSAGQLIFAFLVSVFLYKEKFIPRQLVALVLGLVSLILLNM
jgi:drug/metabolite transporter (DMT)-like permease